MLKKYYKHLKFIASAKDVRLQKASSVSIFPALMGRDIIGICVGNVLYLKKLKDTERNISLIIGYFQGIMLYLA